jgi:glutamyl-tRNA reductase
MRELASRYFSKKTRLLEQAKQKESRLIVTSTCNRTEIYGFAEHPFQLIKLICEK